MLGFLCAKPGRTILPLIAVVCLCSAGCVSVPYRSANPEKYPPAEQLLAITDPQIERGKEYPVLDGVGWVLGIPVGTAKSRIHYATEAMRAALEADSRAPIALTDGRTA